MRAYDLRTADRRYRRPSRDYSPRSAAIGRFRQKKTGQVLPCPENQTLRLNGNQDSHHTRFALLTFLQADSLRRQAIRLSEKPAFIRVTDPRGHALLRMRAAPEDHRPRLDSGRRELR
jgi:hypothetical protein